MVNVNRITLSALLVGACLFAPKVEAGPSILDGGEQSARTSAADTTYYNDEFPVINIRNLNGNVVIVQGEEIEDIFDYENDATEVLVTIQPPSGDPIFVTTNSGPTWVENSSTGAWESLFSIRARAARPAAASRSSSPAAPV